MFAASAQSMIVHHVEPNHRRTICGLMVSGVVRSQPSGDGSTSSRTSRVIENCVNTVSG